MDFPSWMLAIIEVCLVVVAVVCTALICVGAFALMRIMLEG